jgi:hypothetical protein
MRTIVIALFGPASDRVIADLESNGFERISGTSPQRARSRDDDDVLASAGARERFVLPDRG